MWCESALEGATWKGQLVTVPFWANTQLLWYRKSVAEAAGLDMNQPVTWDQLIEAAERQDKLVARRASARVADGVDQRPDRVGRRLGHHRPAATNPEEIQLGLDPGAGEQAAEVMRGVADADVGGPALSTAGEDENVASFEDGARGSWSTGRSSGRGRRPPSRTARSTPASPDDYGWALYPQVAGQPSAPPYGGINLGIGAFSRYPELAYEAAECIASAENQTYYFVANGNPALEGGGVRRPGGARGVPDGPGHPQSLELAAPRPQTATTARSPASLQRELPPAGARSTRADRRTRPPS